MTNDCPLLAHKTEEKQIQICLNCPMPHCVLDDGDPNPFLEQRNLEIARLASQGKTINHLARQFHIHHRTVERILSQATNTERRTQNGGNHG